MDGLKTDLSTHLLHLYKDTLFPELVEFLGDFEKALEFIEIFGGKSIYVPSLRDLQLMVRNCRIYEYLADQPPKITKLRTKYLASKYSLDDQEVKDIYKKELNLRKKLVNPLKVRDMKDEFRQALKQTIQQLEDSAKFDPNKHKRYRRVKK